MPVHVNKAMVRITCDTRIQSQSNPAGNGIDHGTNRIVRHKIIGVAGCRHIGCPRVSLSIASSYFICFGKFYIRKTFRRICVVVIYDALILLFLEHGCDIVVGSCQG